MSILRQLVQRIKDSRGAATSLVEAGLVIGIGATLVGAAITGGIDAGNVANAQVAKEQGISLAQAVVSFNADLHFGPSYKNGNETGPSNAAFVALVNENGTYPTDLTNSWNIPAGAPYPSSDIVHTGHVIDSAVHDSIEGQLNRNVVAGVYNGTTTYVSTVPSYTRKGSNAADPNYGHGLNYVRNESLSVNGDPWTHKFLINVQDLTAGRLLALKTLSLTGILGSTLGALTAIQASTDPLPSVAVFVISAGPNGAIETTREQLTTSFDTGGDDISVRVR